LLFLAYIFAFFKNFCYLCFSIAKNHFDLRPYNDLDIIQGIRAKDNKTLKYLYDTYFGSVREMVSKNKGSEDDARDTLQEAILLTYKKIRDGSLELTSTFSSYFFSVCWNIWMHELRSRRREIDHILEYYYLEQPLDDRVGEEYHKQQRYRLYQEHFQDLDKECRRLLRFFLKKTELKEISKKMGHRSVKYTKKKKYLCKEKLVEAIRKDKRFSNYHGKG